MKKMKNMKKFMAVLLAIAALSCGWAALAGGAELGFYQQGDLNLNGPSYVWWYGCSPTSAGMMMGYYDRSGYGGLSYSNLVPGGAEATTFPLTSAWDANAKNIIASRDYVTDYYKFANGNADYTNGGNNSGPGGSYGNTADDQARTHNPNCLADYMGSGQDWSAPAGQPQITPNGTTWFYYWDNGAKFTAADAVARNLKVTNAGFDEAKDGMLGMDLYFRYAGYGTGVKLEDDTNFYTQLIWKTGMSQGFTFANYKAEIDAGKVVMIQLNGHSVFGFGYTDNGNINFYDTWDNVIQTMAWGTEWDYMEQWGVTVFDPTGGTPVPLPSTLLLMISGLGGLVGWRVRFRQK